jgi:transcriptional regulator with XRE-family HTH domain
MKTVDHLFEESGLAIEDVAERSGLSLERVEAIVVGRWLPSPAERRKIAEAFGTTVEEVSWGHSMDPRNIRYRRHGFRE